MRRCFCVIVVLFLAACSSARDESESLVDNASLETERPNIVLIVFEDMSQRVGAFGDPIAHTPILDALASESIIFPNTFTTSGVCEPSRASLITGVHQQLINSQPMRTKSPVPRMKGGGPIEYEAVPPSFVKAFS